MAVREKTAEEKLFSAAVLRRSFELQGPEHAEGFRFVYQGVLRDLALDDAEVVEFLGKNLVAVDEAIGRRKG